MNLFLLFISGFIFLTCFYGQTQQYSASWILIGGMVFSAFVIGYIFNEAN